MTNRSSLDRYLVSSKLLFISTGSIILSICLMSDNLSYAQSTPNPNTKISELVILPALIASIAGATTALVGIYTYWRGQKLKRKEILFPLMEEFDNSKKMFLAKAILDNFTCNVPEFLEDESLKLILIKYSVKDHSNALKKYYDTKELRKILRDHRNKNHDVTEDHDIIIRASFDAMIKFFSKLEYLMDIGLLKANELSYFEYYYDRLIEQEAVCEYILDYRLSLRGFILGHQGIRNCRDSKCVICSENRKNRSHPNGSVKGSN